MSVTAGLIGTGALVGAAAGVGVVVPLLLLMAPLGWLLLVPTAFAAAVGAGCGAVLAPLAALTLLRAVPLGRLFAGLASGAAAAGAVALLAGFDVVGTTAAACAGVVIAAVRLRSAVAHPQRGVSIRRRAVSKAGATPASSLAG